MALWRNYRYWEYKHTILLSGVYLGKLLFLKIWRPNLKLKYVYGMSAGQVIIARCMLHFMVSQRTLSLGTPIQGFGLKLAAFFCLQTCILWPKWETNECVIKQCSILRRRWGGSRLFAILTMRRRKSFDAKMWQISNRNFGRAPNWDASLGRLKRQHMPYIFLKWADFMFQCLIGTICLFLLIKKLFMWI